MLYYFERIAEPNVRRFYLLIAQEGLFGPVLVREWGRIGASRQRKVCLFDSYEDLNREVARQRQRRLKRGYVQRMPP